MQKPKVQDILDFLDILDLSTIMDILGNFRHSWIFWAFQTFLLIRPKSYKGAGKILIDDHTSYLSFFLHEQNFWRKKFTLKKRVKIWITVVLKR